MLHISDSWKGEEGRGSDYGAVVSRTLRCFPPACWLSFQILPFLSRFGLNAKSDVGRVHAALTFSGTSVGEHTQHRRESFLRNFTSCTPLERVLSLFKLTSLFRHLEFLEQRLYFLFFPNPFTDRQCYGHPAIQGVTKPAFISWRQTYGASDEGCWLSADWQLTADCWI